MKKLNLNNKGFSAIEGLLIAVVVVLIAGIGYYVYQSGKTSNDNANQQQATEEEPVPRDLLEENANSNNGSEASESKQAQPEASTTEAEADRYTSVYTINGIRVYACRTGTSPRTSSVRYFARRVSGSTRFVRLWAGNFRSATQTGAMSIGPNVWSLNRVGSYRPRSYHEGSVAIWFYVFRGQSGARYGNWYRFQSLVRC